MQSNASAPKTVTDTIPKEFLYWNQKDSRSAKRLRRVLNFVFGVDPVLPEALVKHFAHSYYDADPVAETFVEEVYKSQGQT